MEDTERNQVKGVILIVDDTLANLRLLSSMLAKQGHEVHSASDGRDALALVAHNPPDLVLLDIRMPHMNGYEVCRHLKANPETRDIPVIFLSALDDLTDKMQGFAVGGVDYITKPFQVREALARIETHLVIRDLQKRLQAQNIRLEQEIVERQRAETALQTLNENLEQQVAERTVQLVQANAELRRNAEERERLFEAVEEQARRIHRIIDTVPEGVILLDSENRVVLANPLGKQFLATLATAKVGDVLISLGERPLDELLTTPPTGLWHELEKDRATFQILSSSIQTDAAIDGRVVVIRDVTRQREFERRVQHQERLAAVGQLAAGIAHDFNNILAAVMLYSQMSLRIPDLPRKLRERFEIIDRQGRQASELITQILDFSRSSILNRHTLNLVPLLKEQVKLWERTLPENIHIVLSYDDEDYVVNADPTRLQQIFMNLSVNARDAMPDGGELRIKLECVQAYHNETSPLSDGSVREWIQVVFSDTGAGIPDDILPHIFDPFFTTKAPGEGTGLGLAQVDNLVKQHNGFVDVSTEIGVGTTFSIYLPALAISQDMTLPITSVTPVPGHGQTVLVVEDNATVREALVQGLRELNYHALSAADGREALRVFEQHTGVIALVVSDTIMPNMGGGELLQTLRSRDWSGPVVMLTGHPLREEVDGLRRHGVKAWLHKPVSLQLLSEAMARALSD